MPPIHSFTIDGFWARDLQKSLLLRPKRPLGAILHIFGTQLDPQKPPKIDVFWTPRGNLCWKMQKPLNLIRSHAKTTF